MPSNHSHPKVQLTNIEVIERVALYLRTGDVRHLPKALRGEAAGILTLCAAVMATDEQPWPAAAAQPDPGPGASIGQIVRALTADERADADSGLFDDGGSEAGR
jgi:hypothetical protein